MVLDFQALLDPERMREAERERERQANEQADRDARMRASLAALGRIEEAGRLNDAEARFVRQATARWYRTGYLTDAQSEWVSDLAGRHCLVLHVPAGTYIEAAANGYVVRSARRQGSAMVVVPDVEALIELGKEECWSDRDLAAVQTRWGRRQQTHGSGARFSFGPPTQLSKQLPPQSVAAERTRAADAPLDAVCFTFGPAYDPAPAAEPASHDHQRPRGGA